MSGKFDSLSTTQLMTLWEMLSTHRSDLSPEEQAVIDLFIPKGDFAAASVPIRAALAPTTPVPAGWKLVPIEATDDMVRADVCQGCNGAGGTMTGGTCPECYGQGTYSGARAFIGDPAATPAQQTQSDAVAGTDDANVPALLAHAEQHLHVAVQSLIDGAKNRPDLMCGWWDTACTHAEIALKDVEVLKRRMSVAATPPQQAAKPTPLPGA